MESFGKCFILVRVADEAGVEVDRVQAPEEGRELIDDLVGDTAASVERVGSLTIELRLVQGVNANAAWSTMNHICDAERLTKVYICDRCKRQARAASRFGARFQSRPPPAPSSRRRCRSSTHRSLRPTRRSSGGSRPRCHPPGRTRRPRRRHPRRARHEVSARPREDHRRVLEAHDLPIT